MNEQKQLRLNNREPREICFVMIGIFCVIILITTGIIIYRVLR